ncbi:DsbA family protein [Mycobacterium manitobense]|uniref:DsbA family protein n=1 Tax=[Mycobacterium] manitobense TaxID=190147 RepID=A0A9X2YLW8_9MYCO|nr:DsbA family protein [[Mycobacterium] manitobense]MCV7169549.1 DsbA family protein [[Mycobacterium] manitobense]
MATKPKKTPRYDLKAADRKRNLFIQIGLTGIVVVFAVALVLYIVSSAEDRPGSGEAKAVRLASDSLIVKEGTTEPKVVLSLYEDFLCPACGQFEQEFGPTVGKLIDSGAVAADYYTVAILDRVGDGYSSRAGSAAYCVADENKEAFQRFHAALFTPGIQPQEGSGVYPDDKQLIEYARQAGVTGGVSDCINKGRYVEMVKGMADATDVNGTPTIRINGEDFQLTQQTTPDDLIAKVKEIVGDIPALDGPAPGPVPPPSS